MVCRCRARRIVLRRACPFCVLHLDDGGGCLFRLGLPTLARRLVCLPACLPAFPVAPFCVFDSCITKRFPTLAPSPCRRSARAPQQTAALSASSFSHSFVSRCPAYLLRLLTATSELSRTPRITGHRHLQEHAHSHPSRLPLGPAPHGCARWKASPHCGHPAVS